MVPELPEPPRRKRRWLGRLFGWEPRERIALAAEQPVWVTGAPVQEPPPEPDPVVAEEPSEPAEPEAEPEPDAALDRTNAQAALEGALEALGSAHHRPFSRG
jgi:hypothetical protein